MKLIGVHFKGIQIYQQGNEAALLWGYWSFSGSHHDRHCRSVWSQSRKTQQQNSSNGICTQESLFHVWSTSVKVKRKLRNLHSCYPPSLNKKVHVHTPI